MIPGGNKAPYRSPCAGNVECWSGSRYQHAKASEKNIPVHLYATEVCAWSECPECASLDGATPCNSFTNCSCGMTSPYERFAPLTGSSCEAPCQEGGNCPEPPCQPCGPWNYSAEFPGPAPEFYAPQMLTGVAIVQPGINYAVGQILVIVGGTDSTYFHQFDGQSNQANIAVTRVDAQGRILAAAITQAGSYQAIPSNPAMAVVAGGGTGATFNFSWSAQTDNISPCFKYGFKNVQALRQWHGQQGYFFSSGFETFNCGTNGCDYAGYAPYKAAASQSKYTAINVTKNANINFTVIGGDSGNHNGTRGGAWHLDTKTGNILVDSFEFDACNSVWTESNRFDFVNCIVISGISDIGFNIPGYSLDVTEANLPQDLIEILTDLAAAPLDDNQTVTCEANGWTITVPFNSERPDITPATMTASWESDANSCSGTVTYQGPNNQLNDGTPVPQSYTFTFSFSDGSLTYQIMAQGFWEDQVGVASGTINFSANLSGANTPQSVQADVNLLLGQWDLTNDAQYPWRNDGFTSIAPLVTRREHTGNVRLAGFTPWAENLNDPVTDCNGLPPDDPDWTPTYGYMAALDATAVLYDGSIQGAPLPAGYQGAFDFNYVNYQWCNIGDLPNTCEVGSNPSHFYIHGYGGYANGTGTQLPQTATQWTDNATAAGLSGGAWIMYHHNPSWTGCESGTQNSCYTYGPGDYCIAQKWAETKMAFPSQNFARPGSLDRFAFDETQVYGISSATNGTGLNTIGPGSQITLYVTKDCSNPNLTSAQTAGVWGGPAVGGFYNIVSITGGNVVKLSGLVYKVPTNWVSGSGIYDPVNQVLNSDAGQIFGKLRFSIGNPATDPQPILGRASIVSVAEYQHNANVTELATDSLPTLGLIAAGRGTDHVDIYDGQMNLLSANQSVTRIDDSHFTIGVAVGTLVKAAWITSHGAANYEWDDQYPKGDYVYTDWTWSPRLICEVNRNNLNFANCNGAPCGSAKTNTCLCPGDLVCATPPCFPFSGFNQRADCIPFSNCSPSVFCISPNGENFSPGHTYGFPTITFDENYGSGWQAQIQQVMQDLFWQTPHFPASWPIGSNCTANPFAWLTDDGNCNVGNGEIGQAGAVNYYAHAPMVEARLTVPAGAPGLPAAITIGWVSPVNVANCGEADLLFPPTANGFGLAGNTIWQFWSAVCNCIANNGVYADIYTNQVIGCSTAA